MAVVSFHSDEYRAVAARLRAKTPRIPSKDLAIILAALDLLSGNVTSEPFVIDRVIADTEREIRRLTVYRQDLQRLRADG